MSGYVIKHKESGAYVAPPGQRTSYVAKLEHARVFDTEEDAKAELCIGEVVSEATVSVTTVEEIQERERKFRADLCDPGVTEINLPRAFFHEQVGLRTIMVDPIGRLWDVGASPIKMIFDPLFLTRKKAT